MIYDSHGAMREEAGPPAVLHDGHPATAEARAAARRVASALETCLAMPDTPELSYLKCFVRMAFEEASTLGAAGLPSEQELAYLEHLQREARNFRVERARKRMPERI